MVKFHTKANPQGQYYLPKEVREELGKELDLICNAKAAIVYNSNTPLELVLKSLKVIANDVQHRIEIQKETATNESKTIKE
jgi:bifunctional DNA-binding transcriptional regulator/antitoxin component of YhaV-PrlF toxin-antitoxin module